MCVFAGMPFETRLCDSCTTDERAKISEFFIGFQFGVLGLCGGVISLVQGVARSRQVYIELVVEALLVIYSTGAVS
jgi:hypothetical protein